MLDARVTHCKSTSDFGRTARHSRNRALLEPPAQENQASEGAVLQDDTLQDLGIGAPDRMTGLALLYGSKGNNVYIPVLGWAASGSPNPFQGKGACVLMGYPPIMWPALQKCLATCTVEHCTPSVTTIKSLIRIALMNFCTFDKRFHPYISQLSSQ